MAADPEGRDTSGDVDPRRADQLADAAGRGFAAGTKGALAAGRATGRGLTRVFRFARRAASRVVFMANGQIVEENTPDEFFARPQSDRANEFLSKILEPAERSA